MQTYSLREVLSRYCETIPSENGDTCLRVHCSHLSTCVCVAKGAYSGTNTTSLVPNNEEKQMFCLIFLLFFFSFTREADVPVLWAEVSVIRSDI